MRELEPILDDPSGAGHLRANALLGKLGQAALQSLFVQSEIVALRDREVVAKRDERMNFAHFPLDGVVTAVSMVGDGGSLEATTVGSEGVLGIPMTLYGHDFLLNWEVLVPGDALKVPSSVIRQRLSAKDEFANACKGFTGVLLQSVIETLTCNALHPLEGRYARWLLLLRDRCGENVVPVTQERAAELLGVTRQSVSAVIAAFQKEGLIGQTRGRIFVVSREGLRAYACDCYDDLHARLMLAPTAG
jgi:CRP-like cAMP-binding protein